MAALTAERKGTVQVSEDVAPRFQHFPQKGATTIYAGALVVLNAGYAAPGTVALSLIAAGRAEETSANAGADGAVNVRVRRGAFKFNNSSAGDLIAQADVGADCFIVDDNTVAKTNGTNTRSRAGKILAVDSSGVTVLVGIGL